MEFTNERLLSHTSCHTDAERNALDTLLNIEKDFRKLYKIWRQELSAQAVDVDKLWHIIQCYKIALNVQPECKCPQLYAIEPEEIILIRYDAHIFNLTESQMEISVKINETRISVLKFRNDCKQLDFSLETPFILGDAFHKPIKFYIELVDDLFNYFYAAYQKMSYTVALLDPLDLDGLNSYKKQLEHSEEFEEYLMSQLTYCKCLQPVRPCPKKKAAPPKQESISVKAKLLRRQQCLQRRQLMADISDLKLNNKKKLEPAAGNHLRFSSTKDPLKLVQNWVNNSIGRRTTSKEINITPTFT